MELCTEFFTSLHLMPLCWMGSGSQGLSEDPKQTRQSFLKGYISSVMLKEGMKGPLPALVFFF